MQTQQDDDRSFRILLRQPLGPQYLQPDGDWSGNRETARSFVASIVAYWWAVEQRLLKAEVVLAFKDPQLARLGGFSRF
jgi:hypothetical protein